jgi:hypothetical protein
MASLLPAIGAQSFLLALELQDPAWPFYPQVFLDGVSDKVRGAFGIVGGHIRSSLPAFCFGRCVFATEVSQLSINTAAAVRAGTPAGRRAVSRTGLNWRWGEQLPRRL